MAENQRLPMYYSNRAKIVISTNDFQQLFFFSDATVAKAGKVKTNEIPLAKVTMSPQHFKAYVQMLQAQLVKYEKTFGEIQLKPQKKSSKA